MLNRSEPSAAHEARVEYSTPFSSRIVGRIFGLMAALLAAICVIAITAAIPMQQHRLAIPLGLAAAAMAGIAVFATVMFRRPSRLRLSEQRLRVGGRWLGRWIAYDDVRLIKLDKPEPTSGKFLQLILEPVRGRASAIWLRHGDANEAFHALRSMCEHAPAVRGEEEVFAPVNPIHADAGRLVLAREFRRKARRNILATAACAAIGVALILLLVFGGASARARPKAWFGAVLFPIAAIGSYVGYVQSRARAQGLEQVD